MANVQMYSEDSSTYKSGSNTRDVPSALSFDSKTGKWVSQNPEPNTSYWWNNPVKVPDLADKPSGPSSTSKVDSKTEAEKKFIEVEFNTLTGDLSLTPSEKSIRIKVNDTIKLVGIGKYLSGLYYVTSIKRTLNSDNGYTHSLTLLKNGFGNSLKKSQEEEDTRKDEVPKSSPEVKIGDSVKIVGDNAIYSNAHDGVKVPAWVKQKTLTIDGISEDGTRVRVQPINSWTYISNIQKV